MSLTIDMQTQMMAGIKAVLRTQLAGLVAPDNIVAGWSDDTLVGELETQTRNPIVAIQFGRSIPLTQGKNNSVLTGRNPQPLDSQGHIITASDGSYTQLNEAARKTMPVMIVIAAAGKEGPYIRQQVRARIAALWGQADDLPLPDSLETLDIVDPAQTVYNLTAQVYFAWEQPTNTLDNDQREVYEYQITYNVEYSDYDPVVYLTTAAVQTYAVIV